MDADSTIALVWRVAELAHERSRQVFPALALKAWDELDAATQKNLARRAEYRLANPEGSLPQMPPDRLFVLTVDDHRPAEPFTMTALMGAEAFA